MGDYRGSDDAPLVAKFLIGCLSNGIVIIIFVLAFIEWASDKVKAFLASLFG